MKTTFQFLSLFCLSTSLLAGLTGCASTDPDPLPAHGSQAAFIEGEQKTGEMVVEDENWGNFD